MFMLSLEVMGPGGSFSTMLIAMPYWRESVLAGDNGDSGGARPSAGKQLEVAKVERHQFSTTMNSKLTLFDRIRILASYLIFIFLIGLFLIRNKLAFFIIFSQ
jgi:hypothetical protein